MAGDDRKQKRTSSGVQAAAVPVVGVIRGVVGERERLGSSKVKHSV